MNILRFCLLASILAGAAAAAGAPAPGPTPLLTRRSVSELVAVLKSNAAEKEKADACRELAVVGTAEAIPALVALLPEEQLNHMARYALEMIPDAAVDLALRGALAQLQGRPLQGVIVSVGVRKDVQAVELLGRLLGAEDEQAAQAAARALGSIGTPTAVDILLKSLQSTSAGTQLAVAEGLFRCAERRLEKGEDKQALSIYQQLRSDANPQQVRIGAVRGSLLARGAHADSELRTLLRTPDYVMFAAAIRASYELPSPDIAKALASALSAVSADDRKVLIIQALGHRPERSSLAALADAAKTGSKPVRLAAIRSLGETGNPAAAGKLIDLLERAEPELRQAAVESLAGLPGEQVDAKVGALLNNREEAKRIAGVELIGRRRVASATPALLKVAREPRTILRSAALRQIGELGAPADVAAVLDLLPTLNGAEELDAAEAALTALCARGAHGECGDAMVGRLASSSPAHKAVLLRVLGTIGGPSALRAVRAAVDEPIPEVHSAALRALGAWKNADAAPELLTLARTAKDRTDRTVSLRSYLTQAANTDLPADKRLEMCQAAAQLVSGEEEKKLLLAALGGADAIESLGAILPYLDDPAVKHEAYAAVVSVAEKLLKSAKSMQAAPVLIGPLERMAQTAQNEEMSRRAKTLLHDAQKKAANR